MINSCSPTVLTINVVDAQTFAIFHTCKCTRIHRIYRIILYRYIRGIEITGWDGSIRMVARESSGEPTFKGCVVERGQMTAAAIENRIYRADFIRSIYIDATFRIFSISIPARVMILLGINSSKSFRLQWWELPRQDRVFESRFIEISDRDDDTFPTRPTTPRQLTIAV